MWIKDDKVYTYAVQSEETSLTIAYIVSDFEEGSIFQNPVTTNIMVIELDIE